ncbi:MAG: TonB family protein [Bryobacteraceae bacterium]|jgi:TonB family protein
MTAITQALSAALLDFVWQGLLAAFVLWTALFVLRNNSARARYLVSCAALAVMAILPVVTACLAYTASSVPHPQAAWTGAAPAAMRTAIPHASGSLSGSLSTWAAWLERWALPIWSLGVLLFSLRLVWAGRQISVLRRQAKPAGAAVLAVVGDLQKRMRLVRSVRVLVSAAVDCPSVVGWIKPALLLPAATIVGLTPQQLEAVLAHELAHLLRYDYLVNMLQTAVETLLFYHPAVWWVSARIRQERELCCDDIAVDSCGDALCYARALTRLERLRVTTPRLALGSTGGSLLYRIQRLTGERGWQRGPSKLPGILALSLGLICLALNMQWARGQQPDTPALRPAPASIMPDEPGVRIDLGGASVIHRDEVDYPDAAIAKRVQGTVVLEATLDSAGAVSDARVLSGPQELRKAALESVLQWHFTHDAAGGTRQVGITFQLPVDDDATKRFAEARARTAAKRAKDTIDALAQEQLAESMARQASAPEDLQPAETFKLDSDARMLAEQMDKIQAEHNSASAELAQLLAERKELPQESVLEALRDHGQLKIVLDQAAELAASASDLQHTRDDQIEALEKQLAELRAPSPDFMASAFAGRRLKTIDIRGLSASSRDDLRAKLPVHVGDTLAEDSMKKVDTAVTQFDEHLEVSMFTAPDGQVEIHIAAPGSSNRH